MAEPTPSPALPSTADPTPYVPVSWMAVAALTVAVVFATLLVILGGIAFTSKKPLLMGELLLLPVVAIVLGFAARRVIRDSEGTRTGENLANVAWWLSLILGLCYAAYLFAVSFAIRRDASGEAEKWMALVNKGDDDAVALAFHRTLPPGARQGISPTDRGAMQLRFRNELLAFANGDLLRVAQRNKGELNFAVDSVKWEMKPGGVIECLLTGTVKCPEGTFPVSIPMKGTEGVSGEGGGRQWTVERPQAGGFIDQSRATRTPYGWMLVLLEAGGGNFGHEYVETTARGGPGSHYYAYRAYIKQESGPRKLGDLVARVSPPPPPGGWVEVALVPRWQLAFAGPCRLAGEAGYPEYLANQFYALPGGEPPRPEKKEQFFAAYDRLGIRPAGELLKGPDGAPIDKENTITVTESAVEVRVPVEIPLPGTSGRREAARGRVVVVCRDPALLADLKQLKAGANPAQGTQREPEEVLQKSASWRVLRVESDMAPVSVGPPPPGPGGQGGFPGG
jgi:hypothetical protein